MQKSDDQVMLIVYYRQDIRSCHSRYMEQGKSLWEGKEGMQFSERPGMLWPRTLFNHLSLMCERYSGINRIRPRKFACKI